MSRLGNSTMCGKLVAIFWVREMITRLGSFSEPKKSKTIYSRTCNQRVRATYTLYLAIKIPRSARSDSPNARPGRQQFTKTKEGTRARRRWDRSGDDAETVTKRENQDAAEAKNTMKPKRRRKRDGAQMKTPTSCR